MRENAHVRFWSRCDTKALTYLLRLSTIQDVTPYSATGILPRRATRTIGWCESSWDNVTSPERVVSQPARADDDGEHQRGRELGWEGMANPGEPSINVVKTNKPKVLRTQGLGQKGKWPGARVRLSLAADDMPPANRRSLTPRRVRE
jgi:hypothetical protein